MRKFRLGRWLAILGRWLAMGALSCIPGMIGFGLYLEGEAEVWLGPAGMVGTIFACWLGEAHGKADVVKLRQSINEKEGQSE